MMLGDLLLTLCVDNALRIFKVSATGKLSLAWPCLRPCKWMRTCELTAESVELELLSEIEFSSDFTAITLLHPSTYLNKVLVASREGTMQLWNVRTR